MAARDVPEGRGTGARGPREIRIIGCGRRAGVRACPHRSRFRPRGGRIEAEKRAAQVDNAGRHAAAAAGRSMIVLPGSR